MPNIATFTTPTLPADDGTIRRHAAASRLGITYDQLTHKLIRAGIVPEPIRSDLVNSLASRPWLAATSGELTVLRTDSATPASNEDDRRRIGFHVDYDNDELEATSLRWWRSDPERVVNNGLFVVTIATFPVALYLVDRVEDSLTSGNEVRHRYAGRLLARIRPAHTGLRDSEHPLHSIRDEATTLVAPVTLNRADPLLAPTRQIMTSRIKVTSGGPIGYLEP